MPDIIVIGAGVIGTTIAYRLATGGAAVTVLEAGRVGGGTSGISFAWTNANDKKPRAYYDLNVAGMTAHRALAEELGGTPWWHGGGSLEWEATEAEWLQQKAKVDRLRAWGYAAQFITQQELRELEPDIDHRMVGDAPIAFYPEDGWLDPVPYAHAMMAAVAQRGAKLHRGVRVTGVHLAKGRVTGVRTAAGERFDADRVINCAGRWASEAVQEPGLRIPLAPTVGFLVFTPPVAASLRRVLRTPVCNLRPDGAGRLMLHREETDAALAADIRPDPGMPEARDLVRRAATLLPSIGDVEPEAARITERPRPEDGLSAVGPVPGVEGYYMVVTHSGVTLAPWLGRLVAEEILGDRARPELEPFRPGRFFQR